MFKVGDKVVYVGTAYFLSPYKNIAEVVRVDDDEDYPFIVRFFDKRPRGCDPYDDLACDEDELKLAVS